MASLLVNNESKNVPFATPHEATVSLADLVRSRVYTWGTPGYTGRHRPSIDSLQSAVGAPGSAWISLSLLLAIAGRSRGTVVCHIRIEKKEAQIRRRSERARAPYRPMVLPAPKAKNGSAVDELFLSISSLLRSPFPSKLGDVVWRRTCSQPCRYLSPYDNQFLSNDRSVQYVAAHCKSFFFPTTPSRL